MGNYLQWYSASYLKEWTVCMEEVCRKRERKSRRMDNFKFIFD